MAGVHAEDNEVGLARDIDDNFYLGLVHEVRNLAKDKFIQADSLLYSLGKELIDTLKKPLQVDSFDSFREQLQALGCTQRDASCQLINAG